jgi:hypothetical protein
MKEVLIMNPTEKIIELNNTGMLEMVIDNAIYKEVYQNTENEMIDIMKELLIDAKVNCKTHKEGTITAIFGDVFDSLSVQIVFADYTNRFSLLHIMTHNFINFVDDDIVDVWNQLYAVHTELTTKFKELKAAHKQLLKEAEKKAEVEKKAEEKFEQLKAKAIKDFANLSNRTKTHSDVSDFYYALGWLAKHIGTITATMPDYLSDAFKKYFGMDAVHTVVDSKKKTSNGHAMQWTWSFKASVKKADTIPSCIASHFNESRKAIADTSFIWDLVEDYGFSFGKKQDIAKIVQTIPAKYINSFNEGLTA